MSSWWEIKFCATGEISKLDDLENELDSLFHRVAIRDRVGMALIALVEQNYGGDTVMDAVIAHHPDLTFNGVMVHETAQAGDYYYPFVGIDGEPEWRKFSIIENEWTADELENRIVQLEQKIAYLNESRDAYYNTLRSMKSESDNCTTSTGDAPAGNAISVDKALSPDVAEIIAKLRSRQSVV